MRTLFKSFISSLLTLSLGVATVVCCCIVPSVLVHFHKAVTCSHCSFPSSSNNSSNPAKACAYQLTSADLVQGQISSSTTSLVRVFTALPFLNSHQQYVLPSLLSSHPPGGPPQGISFTPLYLRTFNLRI